MPAYKDNDPKGWMGDPKRGAAHGRVSRHKRDEGGKIQGEEVTERLYLRKIHIDVQGYDSNGTYFGTGNPLYWCSNEDGDIDYMLRAHHREQAKNIVLKKYPNARFFR